MNTLQVPPWAIQLALTLLGALVGAWLTRRHFQDQRRHSFVERQLKEFYSPLLGLMDAIQLKKDQRKKVEKTSREQEEQLRSLLSQRGLEALCKRRGYDPGKVVGYDNEQFSSEIFPSFKQMLAIYKDKPELAEDETKKYLQALAEFVELWDRWLAEAVPAEVLKRLGHSGAFLEPFHEHLEKKQEELRKLVSQGKI